MTISELINQLLNIKNHYGEGIVTTGLMNEEISYLNFYPDSKEFNENSTISWVSRVWKNDNN